jgi:hypothetical protein
MRSDAQLLDLLKVCQLETGLIWSNMRACIQQRIYACIEELPKSSQLTCCHVMKNERIWTVVFNWHCATYFLWNHRISDTLNLARRPWKVL